MLKYCLQFFCQGSEWLYSTEQKREYPGKAFLHSDSSHPMTEEAEMIVSLNNGILGNKREYSGKMFTKIENNPYLIFILTAKA